MLCSKESALEGEEMLLLQPGQEGGHDQADRTRKDEAPSYLLEQGGAAATPDEGNDPGSNQQVHRTHRDKAQSPGHSEGVCRASHEESQEQQGQIQAYYDEGPRTDHGSLC